MPCGSHTTHHTFILSQVPSDKCVFNEKPDMKAPEITAAGIEALRSGKYKMVRINYANPDMVGHTGESHGLFKYTVCSFCVLPLHL